VPRRDLKTGRDESGRDESGRDP